tara:strand:- start:107210 stop:108826 length:1617 start_codon:yes stop_codon:yes gene_type:complete
MKSILVTGGAGFIGSQFVRQTVASNQCYVVVLDSLTYAGNLANLAPVDDSSRLHFFRGNIGDRHLVQRLLRTFECSAVVNFAAETHVDRSIGSPDDFVKTNVLGTFELLEASLRHFESLGQSEQDDFRFLHVSTDEVYGQLGPTGYFTETTAYDPSSPYSASKASSDHFVRAYNRTYGLPTLLTNCSNNYGPFQFPEKLIPLMIRKALNQEPLPVYGNGQNVRDWLHVEDHCRALQLVLDKGRVGETYNIGGGAELTNIEVVTRICQQLDALRPDEGHPSSSLIRYVTDRPGHDFRYAIDYSKIREELGWEPQMSFDAGIAKTIQWYLDNEEWVEMVHDSAAYHSERLGLRESESGSGSDETESTVSAENEAESLDMLKGNADVCEEIEGIQMDSRSFHRDERGWLVELFRNDELADQLHPKMAYVSETLPGIVRGPHEHVDQTDYFAFVGPGDFRIYLWDARPDSPTFGNRIVRLVGESNPTAVVVPPGVVHAYKNVGSKPGQVFNAPNQLFAGHGKSEPVDEIRHECIEGSPYVVV